jgi:hypothetical protein
MKTYVTNEVEGDKAPPARATSARRRDEARRLLIAECKAKGEAIKEQAKAARTRAARKQKVDVVLSLFWRHWFAVAGVTVAAFAATSSARITFGQLFAALF